MNQRSASPGLPGPAIAASARALPPNLRRGVVVIHQEGKKRPSRPEMNSENTPIPSALPADAREQMKRLWTDTFGDPASYVDPLFDRYFRPERVVCRFDGQRLTAAMLTVPYTFGAPGPDGRPLRGLYLCGLATRPEARRGGIMSSLIETVNARAAAEGFDFTFLIPASEALAEYYRFRKYHPGAFRIFNHYLSVHNFSIELKNENESDYILAESYIEKISEECLENEMTEIVNYFLKKEGENPFAMRHSRGDWEAVVAETKRCGGAMATVRDAEGRIIAAAPVMPGAASDEWEVRHAYADSRAALYALLQAVKSRYADADLTVCTWPGQMSRQGVWAPYYSSDTPDASVRASDEPASLDAVLAKPYGMFRLLNRDHLILYMEHAGLMTPGAAAGLPDEALAELIWRAPGASNLVETATGISRLPTEIAYLLD